MPSLQKWVLTQCMYGFVCILPQASKRYILTGCYNSKNEVSIALQSTLVQ